MRQPPRLTLFPYTPRFRPRLAPQPNWQTATADVKCAIGWLKRNAVQYGVDPHRIALLGRSAGGHLALLAAYTSDEAALPPRDRKSTRLNSSHANISYAVFC